MSVWLNKEIVARNMGISVQTLNRWLNRYGFNARPHSVRQEHVERLREIMAARAAAFTRIAQQKQARR